MRSKAPGQKLQKAKSIRVAMRSVMGLLPRRSLLDSKMQIESFEAIVIADYDARSAVERELVLRLASVLWRLRRATGIETALFESAIKQVGQEISNRATGEVLLSRLFLNSQDRHVEQPSTESLRKRQISQTFVRLNEMPICPMSRLNRYEHTLWRQTRQIIAILRSLRVGSDRPPHKGPRFLSGRNHPNYLP